MSGLSRVACTCLLAGAFSGAWAQAGIYTCTDAKGRRLTSDRPIPECLDREQKELNPRGMVLRVRPPVPTANEEAEQARKERQLADQRQREAEQKRLDKLLLARYPTQSAFDAEREKNLASLQNNPQERARAVARYDADLQRLKPQWAPSTTAANDAEASVKR